MLELHMNCQFDWKEVALVGILSRQRRVYPLANKQISIEDGDVQLAIDNFGLFFFTSLVAQQLIFQTGTNYEQSKIVSI